MSIKTTIHNYQPGKSIESVMVKYGLKNVIKLASNENPVGPSTKALETAKKKISSINRYPDSKSNNLKLVLKKFLSRRYIGLDNLIIGNGSNEILEFVARAYLDNKSEVIFSKHSFLVYKIISNNMKAKIIETKPITIKNDSYLGADLVQILDKISKKTRVIFIANPNNPTGTLIDVRSLDNFLKLVPNNILVVIDEAYYEYAAFQGYANSCDLLKIHKNIIITRSFSKIYALAGLRIGYGISNPKIIETLSSYRQPFNTNMMAQLSAAESLKDIKFVNASLDQNKKGLIYLRKNFDNLGIFYLSTYGNFITFKIKDSAKKLYELLLKNGIILRPLENYGLKDYLRVTVGKDSENTKFISILKKIIKSNKINV